MRTPLITFYIIHEKSKKILFTHEILVEYSMEVEYMNMNTSFFSLLNRGSPFMIILSIILGTLLMALFYEIFFKKDKREIKGILPWL